MREAVFTVSPNRQYLGIACPTTPAYAVHVATVMIVEPKFACYTLIYKT